MYSFCGASQQSFQRLWAQVFSPQFYYVIVVIIGISINKSKQGLSFHRQLIFFEIWRFN